MSPTISSATDVAPARDELAPRLSGGVAHSTTEIAEKFEALLWSRTLEPLCGQLGPLGDVLTSAIGEGVARARHDAFYQHLRALIELSDGDASSAPRNDSRS